MNDTSGISDPASWVDQHGDFLFRNAMLRLRDRQAAEDVVQDTLVAALQARTGYNGQSTVRTWLVGILKHKVVDHIRRASRTRQLEPLEPFLASDDDESRWFGDDGHWRDLDKAPADWNTDPRALHESNEFWDVMRRCLERLPERAARAYTLREIDEADTDDVCRALNVSDSNLWVLLHRARSRLRECFELQWIGAKP